MSLDHLWAGWRGAYVSGTETVEPGCVLCRITAPGDDRAHHVVWRGVHTAAVLNAFPYTTGHLMIAPTRHVADLEDLDADETAELWQAVTQAARALKRAYEPGGLNVGLNLGLAAGAGVPAHLHVHALPRWPGDTNFMTSVAETRVLPEALPDTWTKLSAAWPT